MATVSLWHRLADFIAPRMCVACSRRLSSRERVLCAACSFHLPRTGFQHSACDNAMVRLFWGAFPVERAAALFYYHAHSDVSNIVYAMKYRDRPEAGRFMGRLMAEEMGAAGFFDGITLIIPMPLASSRQQQRGYNQSAELARGISSVTGLPVNDTAVGRTRFEASQTSMHRRERQANVEGVFELRDAEALRGRHVLLVDDVVTTGATMTSCAREILKAEGTSISLLSLGFTR